MVKGLRILDKENKVVSVELIDIVNEIKNGDQLDWSILYLQATGDLGEETSIPDFERKIINSKQGYFVSWNGLVELSPKFWDLMDIILLGAKDKNLLRRYENNQEMYEACDVVIEMVDSNYWEVFAKDSDLIDRLSQKFKNTEIINPDDVS